MPPELLALEGALSEKNDTAAGRYLIFRLGLAEFGVEIINLREILGMQTITSVPGVPAYIRGVMNFRGNVVPVLDLRLRLGMAAGIPTARTCIILACTSRQEEKVLAGMIVDDVMEIIPLGHGEIDGNERIANGDEVCCILGTALINGSSKTLINLDHVLSSARLADPDFRFDPQCRKDEIVGMATND